MMLLNVLEMVFKKIQWDQCVSIFPGIKCMKNPLSHKKSPEIPLI